MTEVDACFQQSLHGYDVLICHVVLFLLLILVCTSSLFLPPANLAAPTESPKLCGFTEI